MEEKIKLLFAESDLNLSNALAPFLRRSGFILETVKSVSDALGATEQLHLDFVVATVCVPQLNGRELVRKLRASNNWIPVLLIAETIEPGERAKALDEGADDFLTIPFEGQELVSRIHAILRRASPYGLQIPLKSKVYSGSLELDRLSRRVYLDGKEVFLTPKAVSLLEYLMLNPNQIITREQILNSIWGWEKIVTSRVVDTRIAELRRTLGDTKIKPQYIETVLGFGYRFIGLVRGSTKHM